MTFYITTPIYYANDVPHLGHAYTTIAADALNRWLKLNGEETFFLTGTDEHGKKIAQVAEKANLSPKEFVDNLIPKFKKDWELLNIDYDIFLRTTDKEHKNIAQEIIQKIYESGDIYKGVYEGLYCVNCEAYYTEKDASDLKCPLHKKPLEKIKEETYFFRLSKYQKFLLDLYKKNPEFISPKKRKKEIINRVKEGLNDFSMSRSSFDWGIKLPFDKKHVAYVWFDALLNYYSATKGKEKFWPANLHLVGKEILWFHSVYLPAILKSANIELPKKIFAHGWLTVEGEKMGKSTGNAISIKELVSIAGSDSARYFLLRETPFGDDGDFSKNMLIERHNSELANKLGNLVSRISNLAEKYGMEKKEIKPSPIKKIKQKIENLEFDKAIYEIIHLIDDTNEYVQKQKPWETKDTKVIYEAANKIKEIAILISPFIPETSKKIAQVFNFEINLKSLNNPLGITKINKASILFEKIK